MPQSWKLLIGRSLLGLLFLIAGTRQLMFFAGSVGYFGKLGFPAPEATAWLSIIIHVVGGALLIVGWKTKWTSWLLLAMVVIATAMAHRFWDYDAAQYANQLNHFLKNLAIIGGLLYVISFGAGATSVDARRSSA
jgi:putative oxidoreductase